jgi:hypothetical protein
MIGFILPEVILEVRVYLTTGMKQPFFAGVKGNKKGFGRNSKAF